MSLVLLVLLACGGAPEEAAEASVRTALDDEAFRFCHEAGVNAEQAQEFCELLEDLPEDRCPGLRKTCLEGVVAEEPARGCNEGSMAGGGDEGLAGAPEKPPERRGCDELDLDTELLTQVAKWTMAILVAIGVLLLFRFLLRYFGRREPGVEAREVALPTDEGVEEEVDEALPDVPAGGPSDLLVLARLALEEGRLGEAVELARGAALRALGERGRLRLHRSRTDREYVRALRKEAELEQALREVVRAVEVHAWGGRLLDLPLARGAVSAAERIVGAALLLVLLGGIVPGEAHAQSPARYAPAGDAALHEVFQRHGYEVSWRLRSLEDLDAETDLLVLDLSGVRPSDESWAAVRLWVEEGGVLLVGGAPTAALPELGEPVDLDDGAEVSLAPFLVETGLPLPRFPDGPSRLWTGGQGEAWVAGAGFSAPDPFAEEEGGGVPVEGAVVEVLELGDGVVIGVADARLLWNGAMVDPVNEYFVGDLPYLGQGLRGWPLPTPARVQLATWAAIQADGQGAANNPFASLANANLLAFVLHLLAFWALLALWRGWPFGPLRDPPDAGRLAFREHVAALGAHHARLGASRHALSRYARWVLARLGPAGLQLAASRAGYGDQAARDLVRRVEEVAATPEGPNDETDLQRVEELWRITRRG